MNEAVVTALGSGHRWAVPASCICEVAVKHEVYGLCLTSGLPSATWKQRLFNGRVSFSASSAKALGRSLRERLGVSIVEDIGVAIDVSGCCNGDVWGGVKVEWGERTYQVFGEFMLRIVGLAYARDEHSKRVLEDIVQVVFVDDPIVLKRLIAGAAAVVTSRLHRLYSALSSAVPVAVIAWVFKYREALRQYKCD